MSSRSYFSHRIFCGISYKEIINLLAGYLTHNRYLVEDVDGFRAFKYSDLRVSDYSSSVISGQARFIFNDYNGIVFRVENYRRKAANGEMNFKDFPLSIRQRFAITPNAITIDSYIALYKMQKQIGHDLAEWLKNRNRDAFIRKIDEEYIDIIESAYDDITEKADEIHNLIYSYIDKNSLSRIELTNFPDDIKWLIPQMHPNTVSVLKTAELIASIPLLPDYSAIIIEYCKAVEIELCEKLFVPVRGVWAANQAAIPAYPKPLEKLKKYISSTVHKPPELGTMATVIQEASKNSMFPVAATLIDQLCTFPFSCKDPLKLVQEIIYLTQNFRNPAAHKGILSKELADECRDIVVGTSTRPGLLSKIIKAA